MKSLVSISRNYAFGDNSDASPLCSFWNKCLIVSSFQCAYRGGAGCLWDALEPGWASLLFSFPQRRILELGGIDWSMGRIYVAGRTVGRLAWLCRIWGQKRPLSWEAGRNTGGMGHTWDRTLEVESFLNRMKMQMIQTLNNFWRKFLKLKSQFWDWDMRMQMFSETDPGSGTYSCFKLLPLWTIGLSHYEQWTKARLQGKDFWNDVCVCVGCLG